MQFIPKLPQPIQPWKQTSMISPNISVPKLSVAPITSPIKLSDVIQYFQIYGAIESYDIRRYQCFDSIIIQFKNVKDIDGILKRRYHRIQKYIMTVEPASELPQTSVMKNYFATVPFIELNNSLLTKIFNHLCVNDLCSVANTCIRFQKIAHQIFSDKFNKIKCCAGDLNAMNVFKTFGHLITSLDVDVIEPQNDFLEFIAETCEYNLCHLSLWMQSNDIIRLTEQTTMKLKLLFSQLYRLDFYYQQLFDLETTKDLLKSCLELKSLSLNCTTNTNFEMNRMNIRIPKLEELTFYSNQSINDDGLELLLTMNSNIKKLYLDECTSLSARAIDIIVRRLPNMKELSLGYLLQKAGAHELRPLGALKRLQSLSILIGPALPLINVMCETGSQIGCLMLWYVMDMNDALIERIFNMKTIRNLALCSNEHSPNFIRDDHLQLLALNLPCLTVLRLEYSDQITIDGLKKFLFHAKNLTDLVLININNVTIHNKCDLFNSVVQRPNLTIDIQ